jgi:hypothetical protein
MCAGGRSLSACTDNRVAMAARDGTSSLIKIRRRCEATVQELISKIDAMVLFGYPDATIRAISCSRGLSCETGLGRCSLRAKNRTSPTSTSRRIWPSPARSLHPRPWGPEKLSRRSARPLRSVSMSLGRGGDSAGAAPLFGHDVHRVRPLGRPWAAPSSSSVTCLSHIATDLTQMCIRFNEEKSCYVVGPLLLSTN